MNDTKLWYGNLTGAYRLYVSPTIAILGLLGNILVIMVFLLEHKKSRFSIYCISISSTHIIILIFNTFMDDFMGGGLKYRNSSFHTKFDTYSLPMCRFMEYMHNIMYTASSGLLLIFSIDRVVTIFQPMHFYSIHYRRFAIYICLIIIILSNIINIPLLVSSELDKSNPRKCKINVMNSIGRVSIFVKVFVTFVIPTFIILLLNVVICIKLWKAKIQRVKFLSGDLKKNNIEMNRICGHLALNSVFLFFTFPLVITMLLRQIKGDIKNYKELSKIFSSIKDIPYALDFLLYFTFLNNFRWRFIRHFILPIVLKSSLKKTKLGLYIQSRLVKYDSNSSRRRYSPNTAALSSCNNQQSIVNAIVFKAYTKPAFIKPTLRKCISYSTNDRVPLPTISDEIQPRSMSVPREHGCGIDQQEIVPLKDN